MCKCNLQPFFVSTDPYPQDPARCNPGTQNSVGQLPDTFKAHVTEMVLLSVQVLFPPHDTVDNTPLWAPVLKVEQISLCSPLIWFHLHVLGLYYVCSRSVCWGAWSGGHCCTDILLFLGFSLNPWLNNVMWFWQNQVLNSHWIRIISIAEVPAEVTLFACQHLLNVWVHHNPYVVVERCRCKTVRMGQKTYLKNNYNYGKLMTSNKTT